MKITLNCSFLSKRDDGKYEFDLSNFEIFHLGVAGGTYPDYTGTAAFVKNFIFRVTLFGFSLTYKSVEYTDNYKGGANE